MWWSPDRGRAPARDRSQDARPDARPVGTARGGRAGLERRDGRGERVECLAHALLHARGDRAVEDLLRRELLALGVERAFGVRLVGDGDEALACGGHRLEDLRVDDAVRAIEFLVDAGERHRRLAGLAEDIAIAAADAQV